MSVEEQLAVTLRFLATGDSFRSLMYAVKIHDTTIGLLVPKVCKALMKVIKDEIQVGFRKYFFCPFCQWLKNA